MNLLTRDEFRQKVFARDRTTCVVCDAPAQDAHHILERRLFNDGGYYVDNGVSLCGQCHILAEQTIITPNDLRIKGGIQKIVLPEHLYADYEYDKWGNIQNANGSRYKGELFFDGSVQKILKAGGVLGTFLPHIKYPRTYHLPFSTGRTNNDRVLSNYDNFIGKEVIVTVKMDGENTTGYQDSYIHARSLENVGHPSRSWIKKFLSTKLYELPNDWRICGENMFAKHSIFYKNLKSYFYLFSVWDERNWCLRWDETCAWAELLDIKIVPVLYRGIWNENLIKNLYRPVVDGQECEGFVVRVAEGFHYSDFRQCVAKYVRANHVQTNQHWIQGPLIKNELDKSVNNT